MVSERNRIIALKEHLENSGIKVNIGKTKARGNKGFFLTNKKNFRIDIAKDLSSDSIYSTMLHEYAHFVHYKYDSTLSSYDFLFPNITDDMLSELINVSVQFVSKEYAQNIFRQKQDTVTKIDMLADKLRLLFPDFQLSKPYKPIERTLVFPARFLLKYDKIKILNNIYGIENVKLTEVQSDYIKLKSYQRMLRRINSRISKVNNYYNKPAELISRFVELFFTNPQKSEQLAPICTEKMKECLVTGQVYEFSELNKIVKT